MPQHRVNTCASIRACLDTWTILSRNSIWAYGQSDYVYFPPLKFAKYVFCTFHSNSFLKKIELRSQVSHLNEEPMTKWTKPPWFLRGSFNCILNKKKKTQFKGWESLIIFSTGGYWDNIPVQFIMGPNNYFITNIFLLL